MEDPIKQRLIPLEPVQTEILVVNSRFIADLEPVGSVEEARAHLARCACVILRLRTTSQPSLSARQQPHPLIASDDGEALVPQQTSAGGLCWQWSRERLGGGDAYFGGT